jgi:hypothetical protein
MVLPTLFFVTNIYVAKYWLYQLAFINRDNASGSAGGVHRPDRAGAHTVGHQQPAPARASRDPRFGLPWKVPSLDVSRAASRP